MSKIRAKVLRYEAIDVAAVFDTESSLLTALQNNELDQALILWQCQEDTLVLPAGNKWLQSHSLTHALKALGWQLYARKTGGAPVPQTKGVINVSYMYALDEGSDYSIPLAYQRFCETLTGFFSHFGVSVETHATPGSYCDGDYNLNIAGKKVVGTAQRVVLKKGGGKVVLAQACILVDTDIEKLITPVNLCYSEHQQTERVTAHVHTCLFEHTNERPSINDLYQTLFDCFVSATR